MSSLAIELDRLAKLGGLPVAPFINVSPSAIEIENWDKDSEWFDQNVIIMEADLSPDTVFGQRMLVESADRMGRIDLRDDRIVCQLRTSNPEEATTIADMFGKGDKCHRHSRIDQRNRLPGNTPSCGLCCSQGRCRQGPQTYYKGFDSLETVKQNAVDPKTFADMATHGTRFVAFVYFFDRVDPHRPFCLRIGSYQKKSSGTAGQQWHAAPGKWPLVVETFTIDKASKGSLYLNIFIKDGRSNRCISSHRLQ